MSNVNMGGMNAMGGPVGGGMPMMNNGAGRAVTTNTNAQQLNTYIYEYFLKNGMYDCARALLISGQPINTIKDSPGPRRDENGGEEGTDGDSKDDIDPKRPTDLPDPNIPKECPETCFLFEWWCLFWDMFNAQRGKGDTRSVQQYVAHTQTQSRLRQDQQQAMLRGIRSDMQLPQGYQQAMMMRGNVANNMNLNQNNQNNELRQQAIQNNRKQTPNMQNMIAQQKQQQMQRDPSDGNNQQRPQSPGSAENAPSPSKRPRLDQPPFNPSQMPNGRGQMPQQVGETGPSNAIQAAHMQLANGIEPSNLTGQQFQQGGANATAQAASLGRYQANLAQQQANQMPGSKVMPNAGGPPNQGSPPMMNQGQDIANYYNPGNVGPDGMRAGVGQPGGGGGNHALQDYQMQLMLLEQQNKKRLMMARQEQDSMTMPRGPDGSGGQAGPGMGPNGQPFQGTSPQGARSVNSPNPGDQMKRNTPHMNPGGMASPIPEAQSRGSPGAGMNFIAGGQMDPNGMNQPYFNGMQNGMRPPSSHPAAGRFQMTPQQMAMAQQQQQAGAVQGWQNGPNGQMMPQQGVQGGPQNMGTPQARAMPPPSAPAAGAAANGRTQPSSPQQNAAPPTPSQTNKANPKKKNESKDSKAKRATKKGTAANVNAGATPSADAEATAATPTPATPITPVHPKSFTGAQNGAVQPPTNGQPNGPSSNPGVVSQADPSLGGAFNLDPSFDFSSGMEFAGASNGNMDVLQDFDFDSFLHQDGDVGDNFNFDTSAFLDESTIGAE